MRKRWSKRAGIIGIWKGIGICMCSGYGFSFSGSMFEICQFIYFLEI